MMSSVSGSGRPMSVVTGSGGLVNSVSRSGGPVLSVRVDNFDQVAEEYEGDNVDEFRMVNFDQVVKKDPRGTNQVVKKDPRGTTGYVEKNQGYVPSVVPRERDESIESILANLVKIRHS